MNAILREKDVRPVLTIEAVEAHLSHLQSDVAEIKVAVSVLRDKQDALSERMDAKLDQANRDRAAGDAALAEKIDQVNKDRAAGDAMLAEKIDQANKDRAAGDAVLAGRLDHLTELVLEIRGSQKGLKWFISTVAVIVAGLTLAREMGWI